MITQGTWEVHNKILETKSRLMIIPIYNSPKGRRMPDGTRCVCAVTGHGKEAEANARLIAAAPELLAACKIGLEYINKANKCSKPDCLICMRWKQDKKAIQEAIAKAEAVVAVAPDTKCAFNDDCIYYDERNGASKIKCLDCVHSNSIQDDKLDHYEDELF